MSNFPHKYRKAVIYSFCCFWYLMLFYQKHDRASNATLTGLRQNHDNDFSDNHRIIGGNEAVYGDFPHEVSLWGSGILFPHFVCGGSLISSRWVLTAAHCCQGNLKFHVRAGDLLRLSEDEHEQEVVSSRVIIHPDWSTSTWVVDYKYDMCLVELQEPFVTNEYVLPATLPEIGDEPEEGEMCKVSGWGVTISPGGFVPADTLMWVEMPVMSDAECKAIYEGTQWENMLDEDMVCTGDGVTADIGPCNGDSGGGLVCGERLVGVVSWEGRGCGNPKHPPVFTQVSYFVDWINENVGNSNGEFK